MVKERGKLEKEVKRRGGELKELGDIQNWAEVLERDLRVVETVSFSFTFSPICAIYFWPHVGTTPYRNMIGRFDGLIGSILRLIRH